MIQEIITYILIAGASIVVIRGLYKVIVPAKSNKDNSTGCSSSCGCDSKDKKTNLIESLKLK